LQLIVKWLHLWIHYRVWLPNSAASIITGKCCTTNSLVLYLRRGKVTTQVALKKEEQTGRLQA
jgi:hypothetical protein